MSLVWTDNSVRAVEKREAGLTTNCWGLSSILRVGRLVLVFERRRETDCSQMY